MGIWFVFFFFVSSTWDFFTKQGDLDFKCHSYISLASVNVYRSLEKRGMQGSTLFFCLAVTLLFSLLNVFFFHAFIQNPPKVLNRWVFICFIMYWTPKETLALFIPSDTFTNFERRRTVIIVSFVFWLLWQLQPWNGSLGHQAPKFT